MLSLIKLHWKLYIADSNEECMGLASFKNLSNGKTLKSDRNFVVVDKY